MDNDKSFNWAIGIGVTVLVAFAVVEVALQFTSKEMKHSSERITAYHYLVNFSSLGNIGVSVVEDLSSNNIQMSILDYL